MFTCVPVHKLILISTIKLSLFSRTCVVFLVCLGFLVYFFLLNCTVKLLFYSWIWQKYEERWGCFCFFTYSCIVKLRKYLNKDKNEGLKLGALLYFHSRVFMVITRSRGIKVIWHFVIILFRITASSSYRRDTSASHARVFQAACTTSFCHGTCLVIMSPRCTAVS